MITSEIRRNVRSIGTEPVRRTEVKRTVVNTAAIGAVCLCCLSCGKENPDGASPASESNNLSTSGVEAGNQNQETGGDPSAAWAAKKARVKAALEALDIRTNDDAFVTIKDRISEKWLQFLGRPGDPISLYLPLQALDDEEAKRAARYFADIGISAIDPGGTQRYLVDLEHDHEKAANLAIDVFMKIYQLPSNFDMQIAEN